MKQNVLVFPCGSEIGLEVYRSLNHSTHVTLFGGSSLADHGEYIFSNYIGTIPAVDSNVFIEELNKVIRDHKIDIIIPAHDSVVLKLAQEADKLACTVLTSPLQTCEVSRSKKKTYQVFEGLLPTPKIFENNDQDYGGQLPVFLKPDVGQGSKGTFIAKSKQDVDFYISKDPGLMILEYLPGKEYTIDCFTNKDGELLFCEGRERSRIANGISVNSFTVLDSRFTEIAKVINNKLIFQGVWFFQVKERQDGELVLMEIAPRIAGTMGLVRGKGVNLVLLSVFDRLGVGVEVFDNGYNLTIDRALESKYKHDISYDHAYIDFDDLVIFEGKINVDVVAFIFQCINKGVRTHLITRHREVLTETLEKYRLTGIFDEIIWLKNKEDKHSFITEESAIFIDDSYAERKSVHDATGIPVFDAHMIEVLMEKI